MTPLASQLLHSHLQSLLCLKTSKHPQPLVTQLKDHKQGQLHGCVTSAVTQGPEFSALVNCLEILNHSIFAFAFLK